MSLAGSARAEPGGLRPASAGRPLDTTSMEIYHLGALPPGAMAKMREEMKAESRTRALHGIKRYFHRKRHEGFLSSYRLRMLDNACANFRTPLMSLFCHFSLW
jgi:hypothetical protein